MKRPLETVSFVCAFLAVAVGLISLGFFALSILGRTLSSNWNDFGFLELLQSLAAVVYYPLVLFGLSLALAGLQAWVDLRNDE